MIQIKGPAYGLTTFNLIVNYSFFIRSRAQTSNNNISLSAQATMAHFFTQMYLTQYSQKLAQL